MFRSSWQPLFQRIQRMVVSPHDRLARHQKRPYLHVVDNVMKRRSKAAMADIELAIEL